MVDSPTGFLVLPVGVYFIYFCRVSYYLNRFSLRDQLINDDPHADLGIIVVIPCSNEPNLLASLQSIYECVKPQVAVEVIVVVNASEKAATSVIHQNKKTCLEANQWIKQYNTEALKFYLLEENNLPKKHAGVGLARKIGMDEAVRRFQRINNDEGIIVCFDADALCEPNYLIAIQQHFSKHSTSPACSIHFEHPIEGGEFDRKIYDGIIQYELHLRYYKNGLAYAGLPYAFHTIGSSMAVRSIAYQKQNGMNKRKAGEDFYFLQKLIPLGDFTEIKTTKVIPSPRVSDRVPFGTGKAMGDWLDGPKTEMLTYHPQTFIDLKKMVDLIPQFYTELPELPLSIKQFLVTLEIEENLAKIRKNSTSVNHFSKLFFNWFNAFKVLKFTHYARDHYYPDVTVQDGANTLLNYLGNEQEQTLSDLLVRYRKLDLS